MKFLIVLSLLVFHKAWAFNCTARYDSMGIPHQETTSIEEFYYCFGFHHGQDRAWEMDFLRRVGQGRNAEVLGYSHLKSDLMMRLLNLPGKARMLWEKFPDKEKNYLIIYSDGVNAGFQNGRNAKELMDLGHELEEWKPVDSITILLTQSFDQTRKTFLRDYQEEKSKEIWGDKTSTLFDTEGMPWESTILKSGEYPLRKTAFTHTTSNVIPGLRLWAPFPTPFGENSGSNSWVISSKKSKSGHAILANDPHLDLKTPMFWYWIHLRTPNGQLIGASLPGLPVIASGTNGKVAWGITNAYINTADAVFISNPEPTLFETIRPLVWIKFGFIKFPFFFKSFERLKGNGNPVLPLETKRTDKVLLKWTGYTLTPEDVLPMFDFMKVQNVAEMNGVLAQVGVPAWNFVFADNKGNIGYRMVGKSYRHMHKIPFGISTSSVNDFLKEDILTKDERPHLLNPARNYIYTANNRHWPADAQYYGGRGYSFSFRGYRINEMLNDQHNAQDFKAIQCDHLAVDARFFVPRLLKYFSSPLLLGWDFRATDSSMEVSLYRRIMDITMETWQVDEYALFRLLDNLTEKKKEEIKSFHDQALADVAGRSWGEIHRLSFNHLSNDERWIFSPDISGPGDNHSVNPGTSKWNSDKKIYQQYSGASMRMIIEMSENPKLQLGLPGLNRNYTLKDAKNPWADWKNCKYYDVTF